MKETTGLWKKALAIALLAMTLSFGTVYAEDNLENIYHVYIDGKHLGLVENKADAEEYVDQRLGEAQDKHEDVDVELLEKVTYVPEKQFSPSVETEETLRELEEEIEIAASAVSLVVEDETVAHLANEKDADKALQRYKEKFVDEEDLQALEERSDEEKPDVEDKTIMDVELTKQVKQQEKLVDPSEIQQVDDAVEILEKGVPEQTVHVADEGEDVEDLTSEYDVSKDELLQDNPELDESDSLSKDEEIDITETEPVTEVSVREEGIKKEKIPYETEIVETDDLEKGKKETKQKGQDGEKEIHYYKDKKNDRTMDEGTIKEKEIKKPEKEIILKGTKVIPSKGSGNFSWPAVDGSITSKQGERWGKYHKGIDIAGVKDRTIKAADHGKVIEAGKDGAYGNKVVIDHNNGYETTYAHLESIDVNEGDTVEKGSSLGDMGTTGRSTGVHLHFEIHKDGSLENPLDHI
ncbi:peptidoglycan DD-metalloendopeptidase family protein [Halobacillus sp. A1]|uniref:peptidoglycan DD-metalloendopeptidase family protein n=1 Tax=Halobacillus sp. A1 TaxID=2880262 RepID=UPI0020A6447B|nr:peptidoglycan DD-metalloendopeptidase family protein [Halobacillus sp. A1]